MKEEYIKENKILEMTEQDRKQELLNSIKKVKNNLMASYNNIGFAEGDLVDYYIYKIKAEEAKYSYLLKKIKNSEE